MASAAASERRMGPTHGPLGWTESPPRCAVRRREGECRVSSRLGCLLAVVLLVLLPASVAHTAAPTITGYAAGITSPQGIAAGPDGNLWFTEENGIGKITPAGAVT